MYSGNYENSYAVTASIAAVREMVPAAKEIAEAEDMPVDLVLLALVSAWAGVQAGPND
jgi:hypothetical protein